MNKNSHVAAVVVSFHPTAEHITNLANIRAQVGLLIVVDNGSAANELPALRRASEHLRLTLIENERNFGIASALNIGVREAQRRGYRFATLFDQDSVITDGFIASLMADFEAYGKEKQIVQIVPRYRDPETGIERQISRFDDGGAFLTITSGSLFAMEAFENCGPFQENLFIYGVDDEYSLRIRKKGFFIGLSGSAILFHRSGHPTSRKLLGRTVYTANYRPEARYYFARNKVWLLLNYGRTFPRLIVPTLREFLTIPFKIAVMEDAAWEKIKQFAHGLLDGLTGRMGPIRRIV